MAKSLSQKRRPSVAIIGFGRLGRALANALVTAGYPIQALVARRVPKAGKAKLAAVVKNSSVRLSAEQLDQLPTTDLIIIATPDDIIEQTARRLASAVGKTRGGVVLHTSGALSSAVLSPLKDAGFHTGSLHPLVSVNEVGEGTKALRGAFYCLEGDRAALRVARMIVSDLGGRSFSIPAKNKTLYHAAAVMASGHLVALFDLAAEMLSRCGLNEKKARQVLLPLIESAVSNLKATDPAHALTGTFARGDIATVKNHLAALSEKQLKAATPEALAIYKLLGLRSLQLARINKPNPELIAEIKRALGPRGK